MLQVFRGMHKIYCSNGGMSVYLVVFNLEWLLDKHKCNSECKPDCEKNQEHTLRFFKFWGNSIARFSGGAPVILIGTHKDQVVSGADLLKSNAELARTNAAIKRAQDTIGRNMRGLGVFKLNNLRLHMPPQPCSFGIVLCVLKSHINFLLILLRDITSYHIT